MRLPEPTYKALIISAFVSVTLAIGISGCGVNQVVPAAGGGLYEAKGASYYLPRTVIVATVPVTKTTSERGEFAEYSLPLFRIAPELGHATASFSLGDEITLDLAGEKDPSQRFIAINPRGPFKTFSRTMTFNDQGVLTKGDATVENKTVEFAVSSLEAAGKIAGSAIKAAGGNAELFPNRPGLDLLLEHVNSLDKKQKHTLLTKEGLRAGLNVLLAENPDNYLDNLKKQQDFKDAAQNWEEFAATSPEGLREMSHAIDAFKQIGILTAKIESAWPAADRTALQTERDNLLAKFTGKKSEKKTWAGQFRWIPSPRPPGVLYGALATSQTLFILGEHSGISWSRLKAEVPPSVSFSTKESDEKPVSEVTISCESIIPAETSVWASLAADRKKHGWYYRIPAQAKVAVKVNGATKAMKRCFIAQHGCVAFMPATAESQKIVSTIELDPITGALKSTVHGGQAFDPGLLTRVGTAASGVIDTEKAREKAEATANDPVTQLERKKKLLQLEQDIEKLKQSQ